MAHRDSPVDAVTAEERAAARRQARETLEQLDREWTPERWEQARAEQENQLRDAA